MPCGTFGSGGSRIRDSRREFRFRAGSRTRVEKTYTFPLGGSPGCSEFHPACSTEPIHGRSPVLSKARHQYAQRDHPPARRESGRSCDSTWKTNATVWIWTISSVFSEIYSYQTNSNPGRVMLILL